MLRTMKDGNESDTSVSARPCCCGTDADTATTSVSTGTTGTGWGEAAAEDGVSYHCGASVDALRKDSWLDEAADCELIPQKLKCPARFAVEIKSMGVTPRQAR